MKLLVVFLLLVAALVTALPSPEIEERQAMRWRWARMTSHSCYYNGVCNSHCISIKTRAGGRCTYSRCTNKNVWGQGVCHCDCRQYF